MGFSERKQRHAGRVCIALHVRIAAPTSIGALQSKQRHIPPPEIAVPLVKASLDETLGLVLRK